MGERQPSPSTLISVEKRLKRGLLTSPRFQRLRSIRDLEKIPRQKMDTLPFRNESQSIKKWNWAFQKKWQSKRPSDASNVTSSPSSIGPNASFAAVVWIFVQNPVFEWQGSMRSKGMRDSRMVKSLYGSLYGRSGETQSGHRHLQRGIPVHPVRSLCQTMSNRCDYDGGVSPGINPLQENEER